MGTVRFFLAYAVVAFHLTGQLPVVGMLAVNFFYVKSGYLITLVLNRTYDFEFAPFATNRVLRLYPAYICCAVLTLTVHAVAPSVTAFHPNWQPIFDSANTVGNLFVVPWALLDLVNTVVATGHQYRLVPPSWSVSVELVCYLVLWGFTARSVRNAMITGFGASLWIALSMVFGADFRFTYSLTSAALFPFSLGALAYLLRHNTQSLNRLRAHPYFVPLWIASTIGAFSINWLIDYPSTPVSQSYWINYLIAFAAVFALQDTKIAGRFAPIDRLLGDLSYPVFISHWIAAASIYQVLPAGTETRGWLIFATGSAATLAMALAITFLVDRNFISIRDRVRTRALASESAAEPLHP